MLPAWTRPLLSYVSVAFAASAFFAGARCRAARETVPLLTDWRFIRQDAAVDASTANWQPVCLPHTWNAFDGQDGPTPGSVARPNERGSDYYRGVGWYARSLEVPASWAHRRLFLYFEAASQSAVVFLNGHEVGRHTGGFTAFCLEITPHVAWGQSNELRVRVDNTLDRTTPPLAGDFNVDGGLYRPVRLIVTDPVCISPLEYASPGVFLTVAALTPERATVVARTLLSAAIPTPVTLQVVTEIFDAQGKWVASARNEVEAGPAAPEPSVSHTLEIARPHRWDGRRDPYLYSARIRLFAAGQLVDEIVQPLGLRVVSLGPTGFQLNGAPYPVHGVCRHQDKRDQGWALSAEDEIQDVATIRDLGATAVRLAHYPQSENFHQLCDRAGLLLWNEVPFVNEVPDPADPASSPSATTQAFNGVLERELREMILQRYNHPSATWWGLFNELRPGPMCRAALVEVKRLNALAHALDPTRPTVGATDHVGNPTNYVPDGIAYNVYPGWYTGVGALGELSALIEGEYAEQGFAKVALSEYGAGGNPLQHVEGTPGKPQANEGKLHPEEWQALMHERDWQQIKDNPRLWGSFVWVMFDFASDGRHEGGIPGINDKGLVTQDRSVRKDAFYFYRANWSQEPMVYLASRRATPRSLSVTDVTVYSNLPSVELRVNDRSLGRREPNAIHVARWSDVTLVTGRNEIQVSGTGVDQALTDRCVWELTPPADGPTHPASPVQKSE